MKNENTANKQTGNMPEKNFRSGGVSVAVWANEQKTDYGMQTFRSVTLTKRYHDKKTDKWLESGSLNLNEVPKAIVLLQNAYEYIILKGKETESDDDSGIDE